MSTEPSRPPDRTAPDDADRAQTASLWPAVVAFGAVMATFLMIPPLLPSLAVSFGVASGALGWASLATSVGFGVLAAWFGLSGEATPRHLVIGLTLQATFNAAAALSPGLVVYVLLRLATGVSMGIAFAGVMALTVRGRAARRRSASVYAVVPLISLAIPLGGWLVDVAGWEAAHLALAGLGLTALLVTAPVVWRRGEPAGGRAQPAPPQKTVLAVDGSARLLIGSAFLWVLGAGGMWTFVGLYADVVLGLGASFAGVAVAVQGGAGFVGSVVAAAVATSSGEVRRRLTLLGLALLLVGAPAAMSSQIAPLFLVVLGVWSLAKWMVNGLYQGLLVDQVTVEDRPRILVLYQLPYSFGMGLGPVIGGGLLGHAAFDRLATFAVVCGLAAVALLLIAARVGRTGRPELSLSTGGPGDA